MPRSRILTFSVLTLLLGASQAAFAASQFKILASDGAADDRFGYSVAVKGTTAVIGAPGDSPVGNLSGSAYVFVDTGTAWNPQTKLVPNDAAANASFGQQVAVDGNTVIVGAPYALSGGLTAGAAYVFVRSGSSWVQQAKLVAADPHAFDYFGGAVTLNGDTAVVGAPYSDVFGADSGAIYVFSRSGTTWIQQAKVFPADSRTNDLFGSSVAVSADTLAVGAPKDDDNAIASGTAYIFTRSGSDWLPQTKLHPSDGADEDLFGSSVAIDSNSVIVGVPNRKDRGLASGAAYVFTRQGTFWTQQQKLLATDGAAGDFFGSSVSISGDSALVGAFLDDDGTLLDSGSAYLFKRSGTTWTQNTKYQASDRAGDDNFGVSVSLSGDRSLIGVEQDDDRGSNSGSVYAFSPAATAVPAASPVALAALMLLLGLFAVHVRRRA